MGNTSKAWLLSPLSASRMTKSEVDALVVQIPNAYLPDFGVPRSKGDRVRYLHIARGKYWDNPPASRKGQLPAARVGITASEANAWLRSLPRPNGAEEL